MLIYDSVKFGLKDWVIVEDCFSLNRQGKCESIFALANGNIGVRAAFEEDYVFQTRGTYVAGSFNRCPGEVTELPNAADTCGLHIELDGEIFSHTNGTTESYERGLNLYASELYREVVWRSPKGKRYRLRFLRFVSLDDLHTYCGAVEIEPLDGAARVYIKTGINARVTNSGAQHFRDGEKRVFDGRFLILSQTTSETETIFAHGCCCSGQNVSEWKENADISRRMLEGNYRFIVAAGQTGRFDKISVLFTNHDCENPQDAVLSHLKKQASTGFSALRDASAKASGEFWRGRDILIESDEPKLQLGIRFAIYHLRAMLPQNSRCSIAAKALTGEGYKGHVFWDTEIFLLPYYLYTCPQEARRLLEYRISAMGQARENAHKKGFPGLMFPWESALTGEEECPEFAGINIHTGKATPVWAGKKEHHVTADIGYAAWRYYIATDDEDFLQKGGAELIIGTALFWTGRAAYNDKTGQYDILDVVGPDEYTEHVDNDAYTNYMARYLAQCALKLWRYIPVELRSMVADSLAENEIESKLSNFIANLYIPMPDVNGVIPQDNTFLSKSIIDITGYREAPERQMILKDYNREQVNDLQVLKQPDVIMAMYTLRGQFDKKSKQINYDYYEPKTVHDSSLSLAIHAVIASDCGTRSDAYRDFIGALDIDIGQNMQSSDIGIHSASMGGLWIDIIEAFAGVYTVENQLYIMPVLPPEIKSISFSYCWKSVWMKIWVDHEKVSIHSDSDSEINLILNGKQESFKHDYCRRY